MVENFSHINSGKLIFGEGTFSQVPTLITLENTLLVCGNSFLKTSHYSSIAKSIKVQKTICGEPDPDTIDRITKEVKGNIETVLAVGGGSVLDAGKAIAAMCCSNGSVTDYLEGVGTKQPNGETLPLLAIPTTAGTGSEATKNAVICQRGSEGYKKSLRHDNYIPSTIIIDPELYIHCPTDIMSSCGMDAFCQLLESFLSTGSDMLTDTLSWKGLEIFISDFIDLCTSEKKNTEKMGNIAFAAYLSGITLANAGLGTVHGIAGPMGGFFEIPHGTACGTLLPVVMKRTIDRLYTGENDLILKKAEKLGTYIINHSHIEKKEQSAYALTDLLENWLIQLKIPRLSQYGITAKDAEKIAINSGNKNNSVKFNTEQIKEMIISRV